MQQRDAAYPKPPQGEAAAPALSVIVSVRDGARYLPPALDDLLAQTFTRFELIVVDDASSDATPAILRAYARRDARLRVLTNERHRGLPASLNRALAAARAPLVARADADDGYAPDRFERQMARMAAEPGLGVLSCGFRRIDGDGRVTGTRTPTTGDAFIRFQMLFMNALLHPGVMFRTALVRQVNGYDEAYWTAQDSDLWARLLPLTRMDNLPDPLVNYRVHTASVMKTRGEAGRRLSLSVPRRLLSGYLLRDVSMDEARAAVDLFQDLRIMPPVELRAGERVLRETWRASRGREPPPVRDRFRRRVAASLGSQAAAASGAEAALLHALALTWRPDRGRLMSLARATFHAARGVAASPPIPPKP